MKNLWTLDDYLRFLFRNKKTETKEFLVLLRIYGRERIEKAYLEYKALPPDQQKPDPVLELPDNLEFPDSKVYSRFHPAED